MVKKGKKHIIFISILLVSLQSVYGQEQKERKSFLKAIWGDPIENSFTFMPAGTHYIYGPDIFGVWFAGFTVKSFELSVVLNSKHDWTTILLYKRAWPITEKFAINYGAGVMYGYHGKLSTTRGIPVKLAKSFLFTGEINPVAGIGFDYKLSDKVSLHADVAPLIIIYGLRFIL